MKATAIAPSNIAFIKYWGVKDAVLRLPTNGSISMNLSNLLTTTTVEFNEAFTQDHVMFNGKQEPEINNRALKHIDRIRKLANITTRVKIVTENNFPTSTGLSSSASGFAALSLAGAKAAGLDLSERELSILARQGSGSASRSIPDGITEWLDGERSEESYAVSLYPPEYWDLVDIVAVVSTSKKDINTTEGHQLASTSPFFATRLSLINDKIALVKKYMQEKNFTKFGELIESEALEFHAILITSTPSLLYWFPQTIRVMKYVKKLRTEGIEVYFTINTGQDIHVICQKKDAEIVTKRLEEIDEIQNIIINNPTKGVYITDNHLF
ncbi:MAG TPA: diphosphomevalonate decarboxylase [Candidatus Saccharimonadales bacterium]|nr:diphosphomevalonate decarboxylase [Candidatus Saccharimonadales bacterium]